MLYCPICGTTRPANRSQKTCSRKCGVEWVKQQYGPDHFQWIRLKAAAASGEKRKREAALRWQKRGVPRETVEALYAWGYHGGHRKGYSDGYEKALQDMKRARVA